MKKKDIKVGQKYSHEKYPGVIYLGIGVINRDLDTYSNKKLVIISTREPWNDIGHIVNPSNPDFWDGFSEIK